MSEMEKENNPEDKYQAQTCLGWIHWVLSEPKLAVLRLPSGTDILNDDGTGNQVWNWTRVCALKTTYVKGI
jgi:hypothetical protein